MNGAAGSEPARSGAASLPVRPELIGLAPYGAPQHAVAVPLNVNENPYPVPPEVAAAILDRIAAALTRVNRYPDRDFTDLREALAGYLARESHAPFLQAQNMWAANGSNEVMLQIFQAFGGPGRTAVAFAPTYSMYPEYARDTFTTWRPGTRRADFTIDPAAALAHIDQTRPSIILLTSPNNPTGTALDLDVVEQIAQAVGSSALVVVDEAYAEFRPPGVRSAAELLPAYPQLVVVRTMSKAFAFAGARVGYAAATPELVDYLRTVRLPYHLSALTQAAALGALEHADAMLAQVAALRESRDQLADALSRTHQGDGSALEVPASAANFMLFGRFRDRHAVWSALERRGILIRETGPAGFLRVSVGTPAQNERFLAALTEVLQEVTR